MSLEKMLAELAAASTQTISAAEQIARLQEFKTRFDAGNPFKVGDLITPRSDGAVKDSGEPHLVVEVDSAPERSEGDTSSNSYGRKLDIRVAHFSGDSIFMHWSESVQFEPYVEAAQESSSSEPELASA